MILNLVKRIFAKYNKRIIKGNCQTCYYRFQQPNNDVLFCTLSKTALKPFNNKFECQIIDTVKFYAMTSGIDPKRIEGEWSYINIKDYNGITKEYKISMCNFN